MQAVTTPVRTPLRAVQPLKTRAAAKRLQLRDQLWPNASNVVWNRKEEKGFCTVPRTLALLMTLIDQLEKGKDASRAYLDLWCRAFDEGFVEVTDESDFAYSAGYTHPNRNVRTWRERIDILKKLGFVRVAPKGSKKYGYMLLIHPHKVVKKIRRGRRVPDNWWGAYTNRASQIGSVLP